MAVKARGMTIDRKTGRKRRVDAKRSRAAKTGARKRRGKKESAATKRKIAMGIKKAKRTGRTKTGRRVLKKTGTKSAVRTKKVRVAKAKAGTKRAARVGKVKSPRSSKTSTVKLAKGMETPKIKRGTVEPKMKVRREKKNEGTVVRRKKMAIVKGKTLTPNKKLRTAKASPGRGDKRVGKAPKMSKMSKDIGTGVAKTVRVVKVGKTKRTVRKGKKV